MMQQTRRRTHEQQSNMHLGNEFCHSSVSNVDVNPMEMQRDNPAANAFTCERLDSEATAGPCLAMTERHQLAAKSLT